MQWMWKNLWRDEKVERSHANAQAYFLQGMNLGIFSCIFVDNLRDIIELNETVNENILPIKFKDKILTFEDSFLELQEAFSLPVTKKFIL